MLHFLGSASFLFFSFLFFLKFIFFIFYHKRWTRINVWLFLLKTFLPWEITEAIANPAFTDAVFLHQWCSTWCGLNTQNLCCWNWGIMHWTIVYLYSRGLGRDKQAVTSREGQGFAIHGNSWCALLKGKKAVNFSCPVPSRKKILHVQKSFLPKEHLTPALFHEVYLNTQLVVSA